MATKRTPRSAPTRPTASSFIDVIPADNPELQLAAADGTAIQNFVRGVVQFFATAKQLETQAQATLARARTFKAPKTAAEDEAIQIFIKNTNAERKSIETHWAICSIVYQFHRRLTAARDRGVKADEEACLITNALHNRYVDDEKKRAAAEQDRIRREAEERARQDRQRELDMMEAEALERELSTPALSEREQFFVAAFVASGNATTAAKAAGYKDPAGTGTRLIGLAKITAAIKAKEEAAALRQQAAAVKAQPLQVEVETVRPNISKAAGASDRTTWGGEVLDEAAALEAYRQGKHGIPGDLFMVNPVKLNEYGRALHERLDLWPGVRHTKKTGVV